ncbi:MAG TPA: Nramp family divalent metal transporter [Chloroflexota bacterium]
MEATSPVQPTVQPTAHVETKVYKVPNPYPLTLAGMLAALGPQAINFGISIGGGEAYLLPNVAARGTLHMHWLLLVSLLLETVLVYEVIKYSMATGRSFFVATRDLPPKGFWPWFWAVAAALTYAWPAWLSGAAAAAYRFTGLSLPIPGLPPHYLWAAVALVMVLLVFYFSNVIYRNLARIFTAVMFLNIAVVLLVALLTVRLEDIGVVLSGYLGLTLLAQGYPEQLPKLDALALFNQPGGSLMWVSLWVIEAGFGLGAYVGKVTGVLRPPEQVNTEELPWDHKNPEEMRKMKGWVSLGGWSLIIWWAIIGGFLMTFLYSLIGYSYLHREVVARGGAVPANLEIPIQVATITGGVLGPLAFAVMLLFVMVTLYDGQFAYYDTFVARTATDAIATTRLRERRPYRFYYFLVVTVAVLAGFFLVTVDQPFALWLIVAVMSILFRSIGSLQILLINRARLPAELHPSPFNTAVLWFSFFAGFVAVGIWAYFRFLGG